jgi:hypothetical protein
MIFCTVFLGGLCVRDVLLPRVTLLEVTDARGAAPTVNPLLLQSPSKNDGGISDAIKPTDHGRDLHHPPTNVLTNPAIPSPPKKLAVCVLPCTLFATNVAPVSVVTILPESPAGATDAGVAPAGVNDPVTLAVEVRSPLRFVVVVLAIMAPTVVEPLLGLVKLVPVFPLSALRRSWLEVSTELVATVVEGT